MVLMFVGWSGHPFNVTAIAAATLISLGVSFALTPMLAALLLSPRDEEDQHGVLARFGHWWDRGFGRLEGAYGRLLGWSLAKNFYVAVTFVDDGDCLVEANPAAIPGTTNAEILAVVKPFAEGLKLKQAGKPAKDADDYTVTTWSGEVGELSFSNGVPESVPSTKTELKGK